MAKGSRGGSRAGNIGYSANERAKIETYKTYLNKGYELYAPKEAEDLKFQIEAVKQYYGEKIKSLDKNAFPETTTQVPDAMLTDIMGKDMRRGKLVFKKIRETKDTVDLVKYKDYEFATSGKGISSPKVNPTGIYERSVYRDPNDYSKYAVVYTIKKSTLGYSKKQKAAELKQKMNSTIDKLTLNVERKFKGR